jgi:hypothetical protein
MGNTSACARCGGPVGPADKLCAQCGADVAAVQGNVTIDVVGVPLSHSGVQQAAQLDAVRQATFGEYEILAELGRGGMATVYLAHDLALDRKVAIKVVAAALLAGEGMAERFKREARTAASLSHPNIIPIYAVKESERTLYFVMKFIEGRPLDSIMREVGRLPIPIVQAIVHQVGSALGYAHKHGVVHRDMKPSNVMVDSEGWAIVTDFGIAKVAEARGLTIPGTMVGTPAYMSPEQCDAKELTGASDQYSVGVLAYEMLAGRLPFLAQSAMAMMYAHCNVAPAPIRDLRPATTPEVAEAVMRMLAKEPAARWANMEAAVAAMGGAPLAADDPIRTHLVTLAAAGEASRLLKRVSTPVSPTPAGRTQPSKTTSIAVLTIAPVRVTIAVGGAVQLSTTAKRVNGTTQPGRGITWASTNPEVITVSPTGLATAVGVGTATVTAAQQNTSATSTITVIAAESLRRRGWPVVTAVVLAAAVGAMWWFKPWAERAPAPTRSAAVATESATVARPTRQSPEVAQPTTPAAGAGGGPVSASPARARQRRADSAGPQRPAAVERQTEAPPLVTAGPQKDTVPAQAPTTPLRAPTAVAAQPLPSAPPAPAPAASAAAEPAAVQPVDPRPEIETAIASYAQAVQARDTNAVKRIAPGLGSQALQRLQGFFDAVRNLRVSLLVTRVELSGETAHADVSGTYDYVQRGRSVSQLVSFRASLEHGPDGWRITGLH